MWCQPRLLCWCLQLKSELTTLEAHYRMVIMFFFLLFMCQEAYMKMKVTSNWRYDDKTWKGCKCVSALTRRWRCLAPAGLISITHYVASELSAQLRHESPDRSQRAAHLYSWVVNARRTFPPNYSKCGGLDGCTHIKYLSAWLNPQMEGRGCCLNPSPFITVTDLSSAPGSLFV